MEEITRDMIRVALRTEFGIVADPRDYCYAMLVSRLFMIFRIHGVHLSDLAHRCFEFVHSDDEWDTANDPNLNGFSAIASNLMVDMTMEEASMIYRLTAHLY